jgi:hypothetical protein
MCLKPCMRVMCSPCVSAAAETLAFPHCLSPFSVGVATTAAAGLNFPTGNLSLSFTGGALKFLVVTFDTTVRSLGGCCSMDSSKQGSPVLCCACRPGTHCAVERPAGLLAGRTHSVVLHARAGTPGEGCSHLHD